MASPESPLVKEKQDDAFQPGIQPLPRRKRGWSWSRLAAAFLCAVAITVFVFNRHPPYPDLGNESSTDDAKAWIQWSNIEPSEKLVWHPCTGLFAIDTLCARLTVPMDYNRPLNQSASNPKVHLALVLKTGLNRSEDPSSYSESPLLINPGGPGGSGAALAWSLGRMLQGVVGKDRDIIGFDPRGIGATTPKADCFATDDDPWGLDGRNVAYLNRLAWTVSGHDVGLINSSNVALSKLNARSKALSQLCKQVDEAEGDDSIFKYSNTPNVARDMLSIIDAWDQWRSVPSATDEQQANAKLDPKDSTQGRLVYWGFSYGTLLGATFAAMFPDRVGRIMLDGVVDADHYVGEVWTDFVQDTDKVWDKFFVYCAEAGPNCRFFQPGDKPEDIKKRFDDIMNSLQEEPAIVLPPNMHVPVLVTASDIKQVAFSALYTPIPGYPIIAELLQAYVEGNLGPYLVTPAPTSLCHNFVLPQYPDDAQKVIACSDKRYKLNENVTSLQQRFEDMATYTSFADVWMGAGPNLGCNGWDIEAKDPPMRWDDHPIHQPKTIETSFPVLFLSNHLDPVTPLSAALKMTRKFANASIIEQKAEGHCTLSCVSLCTIKHIRAYLDEGVVPPAPKYGSDTSTSKWTTCECDEKPWKSLNDISAVSNVDINAQVHTEDSILYGKSAEEAETMVAYRNLRNHFVLFTKGIESQYESRSPFRSVHVSDPVLMGAGEQTCSGKE
ncbi:hypothetical protein M426DRAFT_9979 [Hypoxylon sp. CI-4A]|nr:hypothetical protein M426DRAFT_9979 [Hypoxylon sp. CI-4A]